MSLFGSNKDKKHKENLASEETLPASPTEAEQLREERLKAERRYQELLDQLQQEKYQQQEQYQQRITQIRQDEQYREDLLQSKLEKLVAEKAEQENLLKDRFRQMDAERIEQERLYRERMAQVDQLERERSEAQSVKLREFEQEYQTQIHLLEEQIRRLQAELEARRKQYQERKAQLTAGQQYEEANRVRAEMKQVWEDFKLQFEDKLTHIEKDKARLDAEYEARMIPIRDELSRVQGDIREKVGHVEKEKALSQQMLDDRLHQLTLEREHQERQEKLRLERESLASGFLERSHQQWQSTLTRLRDIEDKYEVADRHQDIRGWEIVGNNADRIGRVEELIVDTEAMKVRYLDVELHPDLSDGDGNRHLLLPIGVATLDYDHKAVLVPTLDRALAGKIPAYRGETISRDYERTLLAALSPDYLTATDQDTDFYQRDHFDDSRFYGNKNPL